MSTNDDTPARFASAGRRGADLWITLCLGGWLGAGVYFTVAVAPTIFGLAREPGSAGQAIGNLLSALHIGGACLFLTAAAAAWLRRRSRWFCSGLLALGLLCLLSHFGVSRPLAELREQDPKSRTEAQMIRFRRLHGLSVGIFSVTGVGALVLLTADPVSKRD